MLLESEYLSSCRYPWQIFFIISTEACERFSFYGMNGRRHFQESVSQSVKIVTFFIWHTTQQCSLKINYTIFNIYFLFRVHLAVIQFLLLMLSFILMNVLQWQIADFCQTLLSVRISFEIFVNFTVFLSLSLSLIARCFAPIGQFVLVFRWTHCPIPSGKLDKLIQLVWTQYIYKTR